LAEAGVAVGLERTHAARVGERERITVVALRVLRGIAAGADLAEEMQGPRLVAALPALAGHGQGPLGGRESVLEPGGEDVGVAQVHLEQRMEGSDSHGLNGAPRVLQQREALNDPPRERVGVAQGPCDRLCQEGQVPLARQRQPAFEQTDGVAEFSPDDVKTGENPARPRPTIGMIESLSEAETFLDLADPSLELSPF